MRSSWSSNHQNFARAEEIDPYEDRHDEEMRSVRPRRRWRRRLIALTLIAVGIYAYRTYYVERASTQTPPGIIAEETASKAIPAVSDRQSGKLIQDRVGALRSGQQPVDPGSTDSTSRWAWTLLPAPSEQPPQGTAYAPETTSSDQKRIPTLAIRPDGTEASGGRVAGPPPGTSASAAPSQPRPAQPAARDPRATASDAAAPPTQRAPTSPAARTAATSPPAVATNAAAGGYVVQVSSQRSEVDAQAYFRFLQEKFPSELEGRTAIIRRADLDAKGIHHRVMTGPFASAGEADQLCGSLKAAGGQCIIQRN